MAEEFNDRDLSESVFWGVNMHNVMFRDADFSGATFFNTGWQNVSIEGVIDGLVVNGVDITEYVNANDRWYPLRNQLSPQTAEEMRSTWSALCAEWDLVLGRLHSLDTQVATTSINGEWSLRDTLRHLLFAMDKWFTGPILGVRHFSSIALPNTGSQGLEWPGINRDADPPIAEVLAVRTMSVQTFTDYLAALELSALPESTEISENGSVPTAMCFHVVFEEEFEHLRYALRDLALITVS